MASGWGRVASASIAMAIAFAREAGAEEPVGPVPQVAFEAPASCGTPESFADRVSARALRSVVAQKDAPYKVIVVRSGLGFRGTLRVAEARVPERSVEATRCAQVVDALALVAAMALEEKESPQPLEAAEEPPLVPPSGERAPPREAPSAPRTEETASADAPSVALEAAGSWAILDASGALGAALGAGHAPARADHWVPALHGAMAWQGASRRTADGGVAGLRWWFATGRACLARTPWARGLLELCGVGQLGAFELVPSGIPGLARDASLWVALGSGASLRTFVTPRLAVDLGVDFLAPVIRPLFTTVNASGQSEEVYRASGVAMLTSARAVWLLP